MRSFRDLEDRADGQQRFDALYTFLLRQPGAKLEARIEVLLSNLVAFLDFLELSYRILIALIHSNYLDHVAYPFFGCN